jgi:hypothetical protein
MTGLLLSVLLSQSAPAAELYYEHELEFDHLSWCEDNRVVYSPDQKELKVLADCDLDNKKCTAGQRMTRDRVTYFAYCK